MAATSNGITAVAMPPVTYLELLPLQCHDSARSSRVCNNDQLVHLLFTHHIVGAIGNLGQGDRGQPHAGKTQFPRQFSDLKKLDKLVRAWRRQISVGSEKLLLLSRGLELEI
jgi:hypothetical protein